jgi:Streptomycin adenylyltransferase
MLGAMVEGSDPLPHSVRGADRAFLDRLRSTLEPDDRVTMLFLGGSHAGGTADEYSDLDLYVIATDDGFGSFDSQRRALMHGLGEALFLEEHSDFGFRMMLFIYADGVRGEMAIAPASDLAEVHGGPHHVIFDKEGVLAGRRFGEGHLTVEMRRDIVRRALMWFWYDRGLLDVALARGNLSTAHYYLERCRDRCLDFAWLQARPDGWPGGHEKAELVLDATTYEKLAATVAPLEAGAMAEAARRVTDVYVELAPDAASFAGVDYPTRLAEEVTEGLRVLAGGQ